MISHLFKYFLGSEAHGVQVEGSSGELVSWGHHVLDCPPETVVNVHHGQPRVWSQVAFVLLRRQSIVEYLDRVVSGASTRVRVVRNNPGESEGSNRVNHHKSSPSNLKQRKSRLNLLL